MKLTEWYPSEIKPARKGFYETKHLKIYQKSFQYWNGEFWGAWHFDCTTINNAYKTKSICQNVEWRGVAK